ncbi:MAG: SCP2 sterol-binding domain-containing protein [Acidimicrobiales bacterium]
MPEFLSDAWVADLDAAAGTTRVDAALRLVIQQIVLQDRGEERAFTIRIADGAVTVAPGRADDADVSFTQDRATATAIARGELSAQAAFIEGRLRIAGDLRKVMDRARELATLDDVFASARATTTW